ncbi:hypothetical protein J2Y00_003696 [Deinococcus soli (ex Cha et al. 2016)]|uniref:Sce7726 family protein n=1 Tax=Deinococcus soli (ex Cha et al. 2016) TaxID=1309411 RepID=A0AAE4BNG6_9DEIO|nr:sce7726 family protein [Deinococcus soli (ex Cha et al. 2016)]MDR6220085.1 hypothetical protein [Deinococcus soli (ex Cha et al. 2016)]
MKIDALSRDAAALAYARQTYRSATVEHRRRGWYDITIPEFEWDGTPCTLVNHFRVALAPNQDGRGVNETATRQALMALHSAGWAIPELNIQSAEGFSGRADLCVIPDGGRSIGYEIKTEKDSLSRLAHQVRMYDHCFAERVLATTPRHLAGARQLLPGAWGLIVLDPVHHEVVELERLPQPQEHDLAAQYLILETLRVEELNALLHNLGVTRTTKMNNDQRRALLTAHYDVATLRELAFRTLAARKGGRVYTTRVETS